MISSWRRTRRWLSANPPGPLAHRQVVLDDPGEVPRRDPGGPLALHCAAIRRHPIRPSRRPTRVRPAPWPPRRGPGPCPRRQRWPRWPWPASPASRSATGAGRAVRARRPGRRGSACGWSRPGTGVAGSADQVGEVAQQGAGCASTVLPKPMPGSTQTSATPAAGRLRGPSTQEGRGPRPPRRRSGGRPAWCAGVPCMCMATQPDPAAAAATGHSEAETSLTRVAPGGHRGLGHRRLDGVDRHPARRRRPGPRSPGPPGAAPRRRGTGSAPGPGRLAADVDDVGALGDHLEPAGDGRVACRRRPAVGEGVGRDVEDPHDQGASSARGRASATA